MLLIIGYGNAQRRDDGAGLIWAKWLAHAFADWDIPVRLVLVHQLTPELVFELGEPDVFGVIFVDTRIGSDSVQIGLSRITGSPLGIRLGHHLDPKVILAMMNGLWGNEIPAWITTVPGWNFDHGEGLSIRTKEIMAEQKRDINDYVQAVLSEIELAPLVEY